MPQSIDYGPVSVEMKETAISKVKEEIRECISGLDSLRKSKIHNLHAHTFETTVSLYVFCFFTSSV